MSAYGYTEDLIGYGVELSTRKAISRPRGRRGLDRNAILDAAFDMLSRDGEVGFSVRKLGSRIGVDPMTVLHHFGSKDELLRRIADQALATGAEVVGTACPFCLVMMRDGLADAPEAAERGVRAFDLAEVMAASLEGRI